MSDHVHQYAEDVQREAYNERTIVLAWLAKPEVREAIVGGVIAHFDSDGEGDVMLAHAVLAALRQLAEEGK